MNQETENGRQEPPYRRREMGFAVLSHGSVRIR